eukprot:scaffold35230_cov18-Prasinocladus_malaysianus.AAC.2
MSRNAQEGGKSACRWPYSTTLLAGAHAGRLNRTNQNKVIWLVFFLDLKRPESNCSSDVDVDVVIVRRVCSHT